MARAAGVGRIVVDSFDELDRLDALHAEDGHVPAVLLRVTPGHRGAHPRVRADRPGRLEVRLRPRRRATPPRAVERAAASPSVELVGLHAHIGSQVFAVESFRAGDRGAVAVRSVDRDCPSSSSAAASASPTSRARRPRPSIAEWARVAARGLPSGTTCRCRVAGRARTGDRRVGRRSRSTRSARSRTSRASAPTSRSTAA